MPEDLSSERIDELATMADYVFRDGKGAAARKQFADYISKQMPLVPPSLRLLLDGLKQSIEENREVERAYLDLLESQVEDISDDKEKLKSYSWLAWLRVALTYEKFNWEDIFQAIDSPPWNS